MRRIGCAGWLAWGLALPGCALAQRPADTALPPTLAQALHRAGLPTAALSAMVVPVDDEAGAARLSLGAERALNPASVMKLVTTFAALDLLGPDFTWRTGFYADGPVAEGVLRGNLYVRGGGDPKFVRERIEEAFAALQARGVRVILGDMVLDHSAYDLPERDPGAFDGEALRPYNATPDALLVNFKSVILTFTPDPAAGVARVVAEPPLAGLEVAAQVPLSQQPCGDWRGELGARFDRADAIVFQGRYPARCGERTWPVAYQDPASYAARALEGLWRAGGGALTGRVRRGLVPPGATLLHEAPSLPLAQIVADVNQWSNNVMAQQVFLTLGQLPPAVAQAGGPSPVGPVRVGAYEHSRELLGLWWRRRFGARVPAPVLDNGSGLSREERITPDALVGLLRAAAQHPQADTFVGSLAVAGVSGTAARMAQSPRSAARGQAWVKTGTLRDVTGIAGYVQGRDGRRLAVVGFIHDPRAAEGRPVLDALLEWAATR